MRHCALRDSKEILRLFRHDVFTLKSVEVSRHEFMKASKDGLPALVPFSPAAPRVAAE